MCETLDEIHEAQLAFVIDKMRKEKAKKQKWDTNTQGWWRQSDNDLANAFKFVKITNENKIIPSGVTKGSLSDYENSVNKKSEAEDLSIRKKLIDVADQQLVTAAYGADEFKNFMKGDNMLENSVSMIGKQLLPQMAIAITTAGVGNAIQMGSGMYVDGINNKIREKYGLTDGEEITQDMLKNVISDDKFIDTLVAKSVAVIPNANATVRPTGHLSPRFVRTITPFT